MKKMQLVKKGSKRLAFIVVMILSLCLITPYTFAQRSPGLGSKAYNMSFVSGFEVFLIISALIFCNYVLFYSQKNSERNTEY